jgi:hypothetical protein
MANKVPQPVVANALMANKVPPPVVANALMANKGPPPVVANALMANKGPKFPSPEVMAANSAFSAAKVAVNSAKVANTPTSSKEKAGIASSIATTMVNVAKGALSAVMKGNASKSLVDKTKKAVESTEMAANLANQGANLKEIMITTNGKYAPLKINKPKSTKQPKFNKNSSTNTGQKIFTANGKTKKLMKNKNGKIFVKTNGMNGKRMHHIMSGKMMPTV